MVNKVTPDTMLSASRLPGLMGLSKWSNPNDELEYSINALKGLERPDIGNEAMAWGNTLEPIVLAEAAKRLLLQNLWTEHEIPYYHPTLPLCCSLDGTAGGRGQVVVNDPANGIFVIGQDSITLDGMGVIEAKVTSVDPEDAPALYRGPIQLQAQMDIVKATWGCIAVLYKASELRLFLFAMHQPTLDRIAAATIDFQSRLDNWKETGSVDYYPPASGERWPDTRGLYPADDNVITLDSTEAVELAERIANNKLGLKITEQEIASDEERLKELMGTNTKAIAGGFTINWPVRSYKAQPEKTSPAKEAYSVRQSTLTIKETRI
jgi:predicted phage-related endonuclease